MSERETESKQRPLEFIIESHMDASSNAQHKLVLNLEGLGLTGTKVSMEANSETVPSQEPMEETEEETDGETEVQTESQTAPIVNDNIQAVGNVSPLNPNDNNGHNTAEQTDYPAPFRQPTSVPGDLGIPGIGPLTFDDLSIRFEEETASAPVPDGPLEAFDNGRFFESKIFEQFDNGFQNWSTFGHEHIFTPRTRAFLSTLSFQHGPAQMPRGENQIADFLNLSDDILDEAMPGLVQFGSAISQDFWLDPGDVICFEYRFGTNEPGDILLGEGGEFITGGRDFAFLSLSNDDDVEIVEVLVTALHPELDMGGSFTRDGVDWENLTRWHKVEYRLPDDFTPGQYTLGLGIMDVNNGRDGDDGSEEEGESEGEGGFASDASFVQFDNLGLIECPCEIFETFDNFSQWEENGHGHTPGGVAILSTLDEQHGPAQNVIGENLIANLIGLSEDTLDDIHPNSQFGSVIHREITLNPGEKICFDYRFATNDIGRTNSNDYAFISIAGMGNEAVDVIADVFHPELFRPNNEVTQDSVEFQDSTDFNQGSFRVPLDWVAGTYTLAFGIIDVGFGRDDNGSVASMVFLDNVGIQAAKSIQGNIVVNPNEDIFCGDPIGAVDLVPAQGAKVSQLAFEVPEGDPVDFIDDQNLDGLYGAFEQDGRVVIPIEMGGNIQFQTPFDGYLKLDDMGNYEYFGPEVFIEDPENFEYTLTRNDGAVDDTAYLRFYGTMDRHPTEQFFDEGENEVKIYNISMKEDDKTWIITNFDENDQLNFKDVFAEDEGPINIEDAVNSISQSGNDVVIGLQNDAIIVLDDVGPFETGPTPGASLISLMDSIGGSVTAMPMMMIPEETE